MGIALFAASGCWDALDIEERNIATLVIIDRNDEGYVFYVEYAVNTSSTSSGTAGGKHAYAFNTGKGETLAIARENLETKAQKPTYLGAVSAVVLTERMARAGIEEYMFRMREVNDYRKIVDIFITGEEPEAFIKLGQGEKCVGKMVGYTMTNLVNNDRICDIAHLADVLENITGMGGCFLLPNINLGGGEVQISGFSVLHTARCIGDIPWAECRGINFLSMKDAKLYYTIPIGQETATFKLSMKKKKITPSYEQEKVSFLIEESFEAELAYTSVELRFYEQDEAILRQELEDSIADDILAAVETSQRTFRCDYLHFSTFFRIAYPMEHRLIDWPKVFPDAEIAVRVNANVDMTGRYDFIPLTEF